VGSQVCAGLAHAHSRNASDGSPLGLAHCDLSPQHLLLCEGGLVKVLGFNMARARGFQAAQTRVDQPSKMSMYIAPEQITGSREPDGRSDVFSLGAVLWEMVASKPPFAARTLAEIADALAQPAAPLTLITRDVPLDLADAVARALELDPDARFTSAEEMRRSFDAVLARRGAHNPITVVDAEIKALQRTGFVVPGFDAGSLPTWFVEGLGFDRNEVLPGPLPEGTALEGGRSADQAPTQLVTLPGTVAAEGNKTNPERPSARQAIAAAIASEVSPEEAWGSTAPAPRPAARPAPAVAASAPPVPPLELDASAEVERKQRRRSRGALIFVVMVLIAAGASGAAGFFAGRSLRPSSSAVAVPVGPAGAKGPARARVQVGSTPAESRIWLDGVETGLATPARLEVEPGRKHALLLKHADYNDWVGDVEATLEASGEVQAELIRSARISVATDPAGAEAEIDDAPAFTTPGQSGPLKAGNHRLFVKKAGFLTQKREVMVRDADALQLSVPLAPGAELAVRSSPAGADIWLDGEDTGMKTPAGVGVAVGKPHVVAVRKPGFIGQAKRSGALEAGRAETVELALEDVAQAEMLKRATARAKDRATLEKKRDELKKKLDARRTPAAERALAETESALEDLNLELSDLQQQMRGHEILHR
jgi:hypothetical protein